MENQPSSRWSLIAVGVVIGLAPGTLLALIVLSLTVVRSEVASRPAPAAAAPAYPMTKTVAGQELAKSAGNRPPPWEGSEQGPKSSSATRPLPLTPSSSPPEPRSLGTTMTTWPTRSPATTDGSIGATRSRR